MEIPEYIKNGELWQQFDHEDYNFEEIPEDFKDFSILSKISYLKNNHINAEYIDYVAKIFKLLNYWLVELDKLPYDILHIVMKIHDLNEYDDELSSIPLYNEIKELVELSNEEIDVLSLKNNSPYISGFRFYRMSQKPYYSQKSYYNLNFEEKITVKHLIIKSNLKLKELQRERNPSNRLLNFINEQCLIFEKNIELKYLSFCDNLVSKEEPTKIYFEDNNSQENIIGERNFINGMIFSCNDWNEMSIKEYFNYSEYFFKEIGLNNLIEELKKIYPEIFWSYISDKETIIIHNSLEEDYSLMLHKFYLSP